MERREMLFWTTTASFCVAVEGSAVGYLVRNATIVEAMEYLGYPTYVMTILGVARLSSKLSWENLLLRARLNRIGSR